MFLQFSSKNFWLQNCFYQNYIARFVQPIICCQAQFQQAMAVRIELRQLYNYYWTHPAPTGIVQRTSSRRAFATFKATIDRTKPNLLYQIYQTKPTKPNLPNQTYQTKPTKPNQTYKTKPTKADLPNQTNHFKLT